MAGCSSKLMQMPKREQKTNRACPTCEGVVTVINKQYWPGVFLSHYWVISLSSLHCLLEMLTIQLRTSSFLQYCWPIPRLGWDKGIVKQSGGSSYIFKGRKEVPQNADGILVLIKQASKKENKQTKHAVPWVKEEQNVTLQWENCIWNTKRKGN